MTPTYTIVIVYIVMGLLVGRAEYREAKCKGYPQPLIDAVAGFVFWWWIIIDPENEEL